MPGSESQRSRLSAPSQGSASPVLFSRTTSPQPQRAKVPEPYLPPRDKLDEKTLESIGVLGILRDVVDRSTYDQHKEAIVEAMSAVTLEQGVLSYSASLRDYLQKKSKGFVELFKKILAIFEISEEGETTFIDIQRKHATQPIADRLGQIHTQLVRRASVMDVYKPSDENKKLAILGLLENRGQRIIHEVTLSQSKTKENCFIFQNPLDETETCELIYTPGIGCDPIHGFEIVSLMVLNCQPNAVKLRLAELRDRHEQEQQRLLQEKQQAQQEEQQKRLREQEGEQRRGQQEEEEQQKQEEPKQLLYQQQTQEVTSPPSNTSTGFSASFFHFMQKLCCCCCGCCPCACCQKQSIKSEYVQIGDGPS